MGNPQQCSRLSAINRARAEMNLIDKWNLFSEEERRTWYPTLEDWQKTVVRAAFGAP